MKTYVWTLAGVLLFLFLTPSPAVSQDLATDPRYDVFTTRALESTQWLNESAPIYRRSGATVGAVIGGIVGGALTLGCFVLSGMAGPDSAAYCFIPTVVGAALGAWIGGNLRSGSEDTVNPSAAAPPGDA